MSWVGKWNEALAKAQKLWDAAKHPRGRDGKFIEVGDHVKIFSGPDSPQIDSGIIVAGHLAPDGRFFAAIKSASTGETKWYRPKQIEQYKPKANLTPTMPVPALENMTDEVPWDAPEAGQIGEVIKSPTVNEFFGPDGQTIVVGPGGSLLEKPKAAPVPKAAPATPDGPSPISYFEGTDLYKAYEGGATILYNPAPSGMPPLGNIHFVAVKDEGYELYDDYGYMMDPMSINFDEYGHAAATDLEWPTAYGADVEEPDAPLVLDEGQSKAVSDLADWEKEILDSQPKMVAGTPLSEDDLGSNAKVYKHPQGATIVVFPDGSMLAYDKNGKKKTTTATPEKLAVGHGQWKDVTGTDLVWDSVPQLSTEPTKITPEEIKSLDWGGGADPEADIPPPSWVPAPEGSAFDQYMAEFGGMVALAKPNPEEDGPAYAVVGPDGVQYADSYGNWIHVKFVKNFEDVVAEGGWETYGNPEMTEPFQNADPDSTDTMMGQLASEGDIHTIYANPLASTDYFTGKYPAYIGVGGDESDMIYAFDTYGNNYEGDAIDIDGTGNGLSIGDYIQNWGNNPVWGQSPDMPTPDLAAPEQKFSSVSLDDVPVPPGESAVWDKIITHGGEPDVTLWVATKKPEMESLQSAAYVVYTGQIAQTYNKDGNLLGTYTEGIQLPDAFLPVDMTSSDVYAWQHSTRASMKDLSAAMNEGQLDRVYRVPMTKGPSSPRFIAVDKEGKARAFKLNGIEITLPFGEAGAALDEAKSTGTKLYDSGETYAALKAKAEALAPEASMLPGPPKIADPDKLDFIHIGIMTSASNKINTGSITADDLMKVENALNAAKTDPDFAQAKKYLAVAMTLAKLGGKQRTRYNQLLAEAWGDPVPQAAPTTIKGGSGWHAPMSHKLPPGAKPMTMTAATAWIGNASNAQANKAKIQIEIAKRTQHIPTDAWADVIGNSPGMSQEQMGIALREAYLAVKSGKPHDVKIAKGTAGNWIVNPPGAKYGIASTWQPATLENLDVAIRETAVNALIATWAATSNDNNPRSLGLQETARKEFGLSDEWIFDWSTKPAYFNEHMKAHDAVYRAFLRAMYQHTQDELKKTGATHVRLRRGSGQLYKKDGSTMYHKGQTGSVKLRPMSSYSSKHSVASGFGHGTIHEVYVPIERIIGSAKTGFGCTNEYEFVVLGGENEVVIV